MIEFAWGPAVAETVVVVDVLRFTTAVEAAASTGVVVRPVRVGQAAPRSLSPVEMLAATPGDVIVLPSPNGATCAVAAAEGGATVVAACLRNAAAVAEWVGERDVTVIACGERWPDGTLRPAVEDYLGAAAVIAALAGPRSSMAATAKTVWRRLAPRAADLVRQGVSGRECIARGWSDDLDYACEIDVSSTVPVLRDGAFSQGGG